MYHNYTVRYLTLALFALTAIEGHPNVEMRAGPLRAHAQQVFDHNLDLTNFITPDGGYHESMDYQRITYAPLALLAELRRTASNSDPARRYTLFHHYTDTYLYKVLPEVPRRGTTTTNSRSCSGKTISALLMPLIALRIRMQRGCCGRAAGRRAKTTEFPSLSFCGTTLTLLRAIRR